MVEQADLTRLVEPDGDEPFILHPGEFVLASTYEVVTAARRRRSPPRGQVSWAGSGC
jgi:deoxycytidine triphosphate deaminase